MNNTLIIGLIVFAVILASALAGMKVRDHLPAHHLKDDTKNLVNVSTAVIATIAALVLGLLISNANTAFSRIGGEVTALSAAILRLDHIMQEYGADAEPGPENAPAVCRAEDGRSVPRRSSQCAPQQPGDFRTAPADVGHAP
jgi:uncharacterized membrane protein